MSKDRGKMGNPGKIENKREKKRHYKIALAFLFEKKNTLC